MIDDAPVRGSSPTVSAAARGTVLRRLTPALMLGNVGWALPASASQMLLAAFLAAHAPRHKVAVFTVYAVAGAVTSAIGTVLGGLLSDRTRSKFGRRVPWLLGAALLAAVALTVSGLTTDIWLVGMGYAIFQLGLGACVAALSAWIPDHTPAGAIARVSAFSGFGYLLGQSIGGVIAGLLVTRPSAGLIAVSWAVPICALAAAAIIRDRDNRGDPQPPRFAGRTISAKDLIPPASREFWLAFAGRFLFVLSILMISTFQLYLLTDYLHVPLDQAGHKGAIATVFFGVLAAASLFVAGALSDRWRRMKPFVIGAPAVLAIGLVPLLVAPSVPTVLVFFGVVGVTLGAYLTVDQALMVAVLPSTETAARDLGLLSIGSTLPGVVAPILGGVLASSVGYTAIFVVALVLAIGGATCITGIKSVR